MYKAQFYILVLTNCSFPFLPVVNYTHQERLQVYHLMKGSDMFYNETQVFVLLRFQNPKDPKLLGLWN